MSSSVKDQNTDALKRALFAVKDMRAKLEALEQAKKEPIAIVGAGYRLPGGVRDAESFWQVLRTGRDTVTEIPADRWDREHYYDPDPEAVGKMYTRSGAFVADIDKFDPQFFGMAPREAASLDPQQRMLLEVAWEAFENAGYAPDKLAGSQTGVFVGFSNHDFADYLREENGATGIDPYSGTGGAACIAVGRISYVLGLNGPNFAVDTACSSSLVAIHTAIQNLRSGKTDLALAGGVNLLLIPDPNIYLSRMRALSRDGRCKTFDASADGYGRGEGCALIVLKRLSDAERDGDQILALIRGSAINHDGKSSGLTVPNAHAQQAVIRAALADAGIDPLQVSYLEAHGTGTPLGDPIEIRAAVAALCKGRSRELPLLVGSAKTNFAHLEAAAGITGLLKVVLALQHKEIPPHLHFNNPNPHIPWNELPLHVPTQNTKWEGIEGERIAGVSSFGFSGTNAHLILQEANEDKKEKEPTLDLPLAPGSLLCLSAKNETALREMAERHEQHLATHDELELADVAFSANTGRAHFNQRLAVLADSTTSLREKLSAFAKQQSEPNVFVGACSENERPKVAFLFTGQGAQYLDMGRELYETQPVFREALNKCDELLKSHLGVPLLSVLFHKHDAKPPSTSVILEGTSLELETVPSTREGSSRMTMKGEVRSDQPSVISHQLSVNSDLSLNTGNLLDQTAYTQPALFAIEYALAQLWQSWGVQPSVVLGHSVGEYVAACVAGMIRLEDALKLIATRGKLMQALPRNGAMAAIFAEEEKVQAALAGYENRVAIAALNGPGNIVISGEKAAVEELIKKFEAAGVKSKALTVSHAFHSPLLDPMLDAFEQAVSEIEFHEAHVPLISNLTGGVLKIENGGWKIEDRDPRTSILDPQSSIIDPRTYFRRHAREAVRFSASMQTAHDMGCTVFLEIGPHPVLLGMGLECVADAEKFAWLPSLRKGQSEALEMMKSAAALYVRGAEIDWQNFTPRGRRIPLPTYPFQRERYWIENKKSRIENRGSKIASDDSLSSILDSPSSIGHPLLGARLHLPLEREIIFSTHVSPLRQAYLNDHRVYGAPVFPATAYMEIALATANEAFGARSYRIADFIIQEAFVLEEEKDRTLQIVLTREDDGQASFQIFSAEETEHKSEASWRLHVRGRLMFAEAVSDASINFAELRARCAHAVESDGYYEHLRSKGIAYGPSFQGLRHIMQSEGEACAEVALPEALALSASAYHMHPALLDACTQLLGATMTQNAEGEETYLPFNIGGVQLYAHGLSRVWCYAKVSSPAEQGRETLTGEIHAYDENGRLVAEMTSLQLKRAPRLAVQRVKPERLHEWLYQLAWHSQALHASTAQTQNGKWLLLADDTEAAHTLAEQLRVAGESCVLAFAGEEFERLPEGNYRLALEQSEHFQRLLAEEESWRGVVHMMGVEEDQAAITQSKLIPRPLLLEREGEKSMSTSSSESLQSRTEQLCTSLLLLTQALARMQTPNKPQLYVITHGAQAVNDEAAHDATLSLPQASLWGLARTIFAEHPELRCTRIDLDANMHDSPLEGGQGGVVGDIDDAKHIPLKGGIAESIQHLFNELIANDGEDQIAYRAGKRFVARLVRLEDRGLKMVDRAAQSSILDPQSSNLQLQISQRGVLDNLTYQPIPRRAPQPGEVEIAVRATGLNFRDVLNALGMYPGDPGPLGGECSGVITAVGEGVSEFQVGDEVLALGGGCFSRYLITRADWCSRKPAQLNFTQAATIPIPFLTAYYGLHELARIKHGERVLIHSAAGGVGVAATQLAQQMNAEIFGTASTGKWEFAKAHGVQHIMNSRTLEFAEQVMQLTNGAGVDIVLNSLADDFIPKSFSVLNQNGRFLEIGKRGVWSNEQANAARSDVAYWLYDLGQVMIEDPALIQKMYRALLAGFESGALKPLPAKVFAYEETVAAFRYMAQAKHAGKVVVEQKVDDRGSRIEDRELRIEDRKSERSSILHPRSSILLTGGYGGLGLKLAAWLVAHGAGQVALVGRSEPSQTARAALAQLEASGAKILHCRGDVSQRADVDRIIAEIEATGLPLRGVIHAAGVLDDGMLLQQTRARFAKVFAPKVSGAWHLHEATKDLPLDFFVMFSSTTSLLGATGQSNYAAANAVLDGLAHYRRALGLPALTLNWGPWAEVGMAAGLSAREQQRMRENGMGAITPEQGLHLFDALLRGAAVQVAVLPVQWQKFLAQFGANIPPVLRAISATATKAAPKLEARTATPQAEFLQKLQALPEAQREEFFENGVRAQIAHVLGLDPHRPIDRQQPLQQMGLDSLMAVELRNALGNMLGKTLPATLLFDYPTLHALVQYLKQEVLAHASAATAANVAAKRVASDEPIAIIGMACRYPGEANTPEAFWRLLIEGREGMIPTPRERWSLEEYYDPDPDAPGKMYVRVGGFLPEVDKFDPRFFGITPREAVSMDPQQRLLLEVVWEALENAGLAPHKLVGSATGVYVGAGGMDYSLMQMRKYDAQRIDAYAGTGSALSVASGRISYTLGLQGPCLTVDTACSSSLVALHLACQSLRNGESEMALACGINIILSPEATINFCKARMLAPDGHCKTFDAAADGYVRGEGFGVVVIKRLADAQRDNDNILALIRGTAVNQDGKSNGLTAPNGPAQEEVIRQALDSAGIAPHEIDYVEAHGTGTPLGDPIEVRAIGNVLRAGRTPERTLLLGSVKTNIGHTETAAGIAGLIKLVLALQHEMIPAHLNFKKLNPHISLAEIPAEIVTTPRAWPRNGKPRLAGLNSFGFSGTNAHVVLQGAKEDKKEKEPSSNLPLAPCSLLCLSAKSEASLRALAQRYADYLQANIEVSLADVCYTAYVGRSHFDHRLGVVANNAEEMRAKLAAFANGETPSGAHYHYSLSGSRPKIAFLFTGQGSQYIDMGRELYETQPVFREALNKCDALLRPYLEVPLLSVLFDSPLEGGQEGVGGDVKNAFVAVDAKHTGVQHSASNIEHPATSNQQPATNLLDQTRYTQPALFALEYALAELWQSWGVKPSVVLGHSVGEYAAACVAGMMRLEDGIKLIAERGRLMQALPRETRGAMVAIFAEEEKVKAGLAGYESRVSIAAINDPTNIVISGEKSAVEEIARKFETSGVKSKALTVSHAFHSPLMEPMLDAFEQAVHGIDFQAPRVPLISNLTGGVLKIENGEWKIEDRDPRTSILNPQSSSLDPQTYYRRHVREAVRFSASMQTLHEQGCDVYLEVGPSPVLLGMGKKSLPASEAAWLPSLRKDRANEQDMLTSLAALYTRGIEIDWNKLEREPARRKKVLLPNYPFARERYWVDLGASGKTSALTSAWSTHPLLGEKLALPLAHEVVFALPLSAQTLPFLDDHRVYGNVVFPATAYLEVAAAAVAEAFGGDAHEVRNFVIQEALVLREGETAKLHVVVKRNDDAASFQIFSAAQRSEEGTQNVWRLHAQGQVAFAVAVPSQSVALAALQQRCAEEISAAEYYETMRASGMEYGPNFRGIMQLYRGESEALAEIRLPEELRNEAEAYRLHPALLDACFQILGAALPREMEAEAYLPINIERFQLYRTGSSDLWCHLALAQSVQAKPETLRGNLIIMNAEGETVAEISGLILKRAGRDALQRVMTTAWQEWLYRVQWQPQTLPPTQTQNVREQRWLILSDDNGVGENIAQQITAQGGHYTLVFHGEETRTLGENRFALNALAVEAWQKFFAEHSAFDGIVHLWSIVQNTTALEAATLQLNVGALHLVQVASKLAKKPRLYFITNDAQKVEAKEQASNLPAASLWGLSRTIAAEHPELRCTRIDVDDIALSNEQPATSNQQLLLELLANDSEDQIAYHAGKRYVARLVKLEDRGLKIVDRAAQSSILDPQSSNLQLQISQRGVLDNLAYQPIARRAPQAGEVEIAVRATGLNFRDVLNALGMYPGDPGPLGGECSGVITAVGEGVSEFNVGDEVLALGGGCFGTFVITRADWCCPKPKSFTFAEAATIPIPFLTAYYGLHELARIKQGERVLIHSAAGGVGVAATQLAQQMNAEIFGTASTGKWEFAKAHGVQHIMNSRTLEFAEQVMQLTNGQGVDLVLNSLADDFIPKSFSVLNQNGRFLEIGKRGVWSNEQANAARSDVAYWLYDLGQVMIEDPALIQKMYHALLAGFESGALKPLPAKVFAYEETVAAFRYMAQAKHAGKVVVEQKVADRGSRIEDRKSERSSILHPRSSILLTGGYGGLGLKLAAWLVAHGAGQVALVGRSEPSQAARETLAQLEASGAKILHCRGDVAHRADVDRIIAEIEATGLPLRGVIHAAGVLDDGMLLQQTRARFAKVFAPKISGAWHLHEATKELPLDFFVLFSSITSVLGSTGQGNYAAANAFLDSLAQHRRALGLPGMSINWGPWDEAGMAANLGARERERFMQQGLSLIAPDAGLQAFAHLLASNAEQAVVLAVQWRKFLQGAAEAPPMLRALAGAQKAKAPSAEKAKPALPANALLKKMQDAPREQRRDLLAAHVRGVATKVLGLPSIEALSVQQPFSELGMDSLMAVELRNALGQSIGRELPATLLFDYPTVAKLATHLAQEVLELEKETPAAAVVAQAPRKADEPIAIIGMGCRFPGANSPAEFWQLLREGRDAVSEVPRSRWNIDEYYDPDPDAPGKMYVRKGGFIDDVDKFDPRFFGISPREAITMDPQQRLLLEVAWEALEHAGLIPENLMGSLTGVFIGISTSDYAHLQAGGDVAGRIDAYSGTGSAFSVAAGRLAYALGLQGPNLAVDTACSSSLVALHLACQSLRNGEAQLALAGGVNAILSPSSTINFSKARMLAADGHCKTFDASADGYVRGEGCGIIVLKRLSDAERDGDNILGLVRGSAINQDGKSNGLTAPNGPAQEEVIRRALAAANVAPHEIDYVEAHGTGTALGDPIEVHALKNVLRAGRTAEHPLYLASVKTNFGHLEAAAGMAGLIKVVLALQHGEIPAHLHFKQLNPHVTLEDFPLVIPTRTQAWPQNGKTRLAGLSSFGFSGTNAHVVLQGANEDKKEKEPSLSLPLAPYAMLCLAAKSEASLRALARRYAEYLAAHAETALPDLCYSAITRRSQFEQRVALLGESVEQMRSQLAAFAKGERIASVVHAKAQEAPKIAFLFTGQGSQYIDMGRELYATQPVFRAALDKCDALLRPHLEVPLLSVLFSEQYLTPPSSSVILEGPSLELGAVPSAREVSFRMTSSLPSSHHLLDQTRYTQPALFAIEYALAELWQSWGIKPSVVLGHSVGEYVAACVAGMMSLEDGLKLIAARGKLMQALPANGAMVAIFAEEEKIKAALVGYEERVSIAAINDPSNIVFSGEQSAVDEIVRALETSGVKSKALTVSHAFHSPLLEPMLDAFEQVVSEIEFHEPRVPLISNLTGCELKIENGEWKMEGLDPQSSIINPRIYYRRHAREAVRFADSIRTLQEQGCTLFLEIGPSPVLASMGMRCVPEGYGVWLPSLRKGQNDSQQMLKSLGALHAHGATVDWQNFYREQNVCRIALPTYAFAKERYWIEQATPKFKTRSTIHDPQSSSLHPLLGQRLRSPLLKAQVFEAQIGIDSVPFLQDHRVYGAAVFPATAYVEIALAAAHKRFGKEAYTLEDFSIQTALTFDKEEARTLQVVLTNTDAGAALQIFSAAQTDAEEERAWTLHAEGKIRRVVHDKTENLNGKAEFLSLHTLQARCDEETSIAEYYARLHRGGLEYGPSFQGLAQLFAGESEALGRVRLPEILENEAARYQIHPALLDGCLQVLGASAKHNGEVDAEPAAYLPVGFGSLQQHAPLGKEVWCHVALEPDTNQTEMRTAHIRVCDEHGALLVRITNLRLKRAPRELQQRALQQRVQDWFYQIVWQPQTLEQRNDSAQGSADNWLIFADRSGMSAALANMLEARGESCTLVFSGASYRQRDAKSFEINPTRAEDFANVLQACAHAPRGVVHLWSLDHRFNGDAKAEALAAAVEVTCGSVLHLVQASMQQQWREQPRLWLITQGAQPVLDVSAAHDTSTSPLTPLKGGIILSPLWGMASSLAAEHPELRCACVDLDAGTEQFNAQALFAELTADAKEDRIALRGEARYVARLVKIEERREKGEEREAESMLHAPSSTPLQLHIKQRGVLDNLQWQPTPRREPQAGEVEIEVRATGLNFRDVLNALGMYPGDAGSMGAECAGVIVAVGEDVSAFAVGDEVIALAAACFASYVTTRVEFVAHKPHACSFAQAATIPVTFLTTYYGLQHLAKLQRGERVLIHAAAGGVGIAAVQLAQHMGAEIFATASLSKWEYLKALGVQHVMNSRTLDFADEIMRLTNNEGVHVVLNSLAGEFIPKSLGVLAPRGRFLEIGKRDIWSNEKVASVRPEVSNFIYDLAALMNDDPTLIQSMLRELMTLFTAGALQPLPVKTFAREEVVSAFRYMAGAKHVGKVVVEQKIENRGSRIEDRGLRIENRESKIEARSSNLYTLSSIFHPPSTILLTGGLGALGLRVAEWLVEKGARHLLLAGRTAPKAEALAVIQKLEQRGAKIVVARGDVADEVQAAFVLDHIAQHNMPPLKGIMHAAGVLDDGVLVQQTWSRFAKVLAPKLQGAWNLHALTQDAPLDFFVLFSSMASVFPSPGQSNYAAANAFLDGLAHHRRAHGLPALSINWGPWAEAGMAVENAKRRASNGLDVIAPEQGVHALELALQKELAQILIAPMAWEKLLRGTAVPPLFAVLQATAAQTDHAEASTAASLLQTLHAAPAKARYEILLSELHALALKTLALPANEAIDPSKPLSALGLDSLMAVELRNALNHALGLSLPASLLFDYPSLASLAEFLFNKELKLNGEAQAEMIDKQEEQRAHMIDEIKQLSEAEVEASLAAELEQLLK